MILDLIWNDCNTNSFVSLKQNDTEFCVAHNSEISDIASFLFDIQGYFARESWSFCCNLWNNHISICSEIWEWRYWFSNGINESSFCLFHFVFRSLDMSFLNGWIMISDWYRSSFCSTNVLRSDRRAPRNFHSSLLVLSPLRWTQQMILYIDTCYCNLKIMEKIGFWAGDIIHDLHS